MAECIPLEDSFPAPQPPTWADGKPPRRILVVDDQVKIIKALRRLLLAHGYEVLTASSGLQGLELAQQHLPDLMLLDVGMPGVDGFSVCRELRQWSAIPIIIVSVFDDERLKVLALDLGADDYLIKPFGFEELLARIRACLRRSGLAAPAAPAEPSSLITSDDGYVVVDLATHRVLVRAQEVHLNRKEFELLHHLMRAAGRVITHRRLLRLVWGPDYEEQLEYLRTYMRQLRLKVEQDASHPRYLLTEPGVGYVFRGQS